MLGFKLINFSERGPGLHVLIQHSVLFSLGDCCTSRLKFHTFHLRRSMMCISVHWRPNESDDVSNHQPHSCLLKRLFRHRSKKTSKLCVTCLCDGNSPVPFDDVIISRPLSSFPVSSADVSALGTNACWLTSKLSTVFSAFSRFTAEQLLQPPARSSNFCHLSRKR